MNLTNALDDVATGEATLDRAAAAIGGALDRLNDATADRLYAALRSWTWKALESRRRDDELDAWMDLLGRAASHLEDGWRDLACKIEGFVELLHASVMAAGAARSVDPRRRKHVRGILSLVYKAGGRLPRHDLIRLTGLRDANLSNVIAPLRDRGWLQREMDGREATYRLTEKGREIAAAIIVDEPVLSDIAAIEIMAPRIEDTIPFKYTRVPQVKMHSWGNMFDERSNEPPSYYDFLDVEDVTLRDASTNSFERDGMVSMLRAMRLMSLEQPVTGAGAGR